MGKKSPAKWIKAVLFGKKHSKSQLSKHVSSDKKTPLEDPNDPVQLTERGTDSGCELEKEKTDSPCDDTSSHPPKQGVDSPSREATVQASDPEMAREEQAATKVQAAFRGYLARRAFRTLKGIIRLQALIRGHLVRRQAVATLRCMRAIVHFQALARGRSVRLSDANNRHRVLEKHIKTRDPDRGVNGTITNKFLASENLTTNAFIRKLLATVPNAMPLALLYDSSEPNSSWNWLDRWSSSRFWAHPARTEKCPPKSKPQEIQSSLHIAAGVEHVKSKRTVRKVSGTANGDNGASSYLETDKKLERNLRMVTTEHTEPTQDQPRTELERVKHNLRKVSALAGYKESEPVPVVSEQETAIPSSANMDNSDFVAETTANGTIEGCNEIPDETRSSENGAKLEKTVQILEEDACKEEPSSGTKGNPRIRKRKSLPAKLEHAENNTSKNSTTVPSYMAATESAKAKLRAQAPSSKSSEDGASANGKFSSLSPRMHKPARANGISGSGRNNRSRDDKALQAGWRK